MHKALQRAFLLALILILSGTLRNLQSRSFIKAEAQKQLKMSEMIRKETEELNEEEDLQHYAKINPDFQAVLRFESGLIDLPVVQGNDNSFYLSHLFDCSEGITGTLFFDVQCEKDDRVRIIYGHSVFTEPSLMFTSLHALKDQSVYEESRFFDLISPEGTSRYEIISVFINDEERPDFIDTRIRDFTDQQSEAAFFEEIHRRSLITPHTVLRPYDRILILQTCCDEDSGQRLCVIAAMKEPVQQD